MDQLDRRSFITKAAAGGFALTTGIDLTACGAAARQAAHRVAPAPSQTLEQAIRGHVFERRTPGFSDAAHVYNSLFDHVLPKFVARPVDPADVAAAVRWAVRHAVPMRARSGGHSYAGYSTLPDGLVIDLRRLANISLDRRSGIATIGAGAPLINVYTALAGHGATIPAGTCPSVGVGGHALGGGVGLAGRAFGLALDNLVEIELVTGDGRLRTVSRRNEPDLFWALRGAGGGNFGIVTQLRFRVHRLPPVASWVTMSWPWTQASAALATWQSWQPHATDRFSSVFHLATSRFGPVVQLTGQYLGPAADVPGLVSSLRAVPGASLNFGQEGYLRMQMLWAGCASKSFSACHTVGTYPGSTLLRAGFRAGSDYVNRPLPDAGRAALIQAIARRQVEPGSGAILLDSYGGAINRISPSATAFVHRNSLACIQYLSYASGWGWLERTRAAMRPYVSGFCYQNYIDPTLRNWQHAYYGSNYRRLEAIRRHVDPQHHFNYPQAIGR